MDPKTYIHVIPMPKKAPEMTGEIQCVLLAVHANQNKETCYFNQCTGKGPPVRNAYWEANGSGHAHWQPRFGTEGILVLEISLFKVESIMKISGWLQRYGLRERTDSKRHTRGKPIALQPVETRMGGWIRPISIHSPSGRTRLGSSRNKSICTEALSQSLDDDVKQRNRTGLRI